MSEPQLLCLDEPSLGLAPIIVQDIFKTIRSINAAGTSVLLVDRDAKCFIAISAPADLIAPKRSSTRA